MIEIERKFLVKNESFKDSSYAKTLFKQAYLNSSPERSVRIRVCDGKGFITVKGISSESGASRFEWEKEIPEAEAEDLLHLCEPGKIEKYRYLVRSGDHIIEVDEFLGDNEGLIIAEIELSSEDENFKVPEWLGEEVTGKKEYYNSYIATHPYKLKK